MVGNAGSLSRNASGSQRLTVPYNVRRTVLNTVKDHTSLLPNTRTHTFHTISTDVRIPSRLRNAFVMTISVCAVLIAGCGAPKTATYSDPNPPGAFAGSERDPIEEYGRMSFEQQVSIAQVEARVKAAKELLRHGASDDARTQLQLASDGPLITVFGAVIHANIRAARTLRDAWVTAGAPLPEAQALQLIGPFTDVIQPSRPNTKPTTLRPAGTPQSVTYPDTTVQSSAALTIANLTNLEHQLHEAAAIVATPTSLHDDGWNAAIDSQLLDDVGTSYENAFLDGTSSNATSEYAYGWAVANLVMQRLNQLPARQSHDIGVQLDRFIRTYFPRITPSEGNHDTDVVVEKQQNIGAMMQDVFGVVVDGSEPRASSTSCLTSVKSLLKTAEKLVDSHAKRDAIESTMIRANTTYDRCSSDVAALDSVLAGRIDVKLAVLQGDALEPALLSDATAVSASAASDLDEAISLVKSELDALRAS